VKKTQNSRPIPISPLESASEWLKKKGVLGRVTDNDYDCVTLPMAKIMVPIRRLWG
jgi:hypothetical protein